MTSTPTPPGAVKQTSLPVGAGILMIIAGAGELIAGLAISTIGAVVTFFIAGLGGVFGFPLIILGIVAIVGGIYALRRRAWGMALAGAICALFLPYGGTVLGILAIIFVAISKQEFK
jgi:hypothetical protein